MILPRLRLLHPKALQSGKCLATAMLNESEYTSTPQYPPILDTSHTARSMRKKLGRHDEIKAVKTVEEKQLKLNMERYHGFKTYMFPEEITNYNNLHLIQHITRTHLIEGDVLPPFYDGIKVDEAAKNLMPQIEEAILLEMDGYRRVEDIRGEDLDAVSLENIISRAVSKQLNRLLLNELASSCKHLIDTQVDYEPRIESSWVVGGMNPPEAARRYRRAVEWRKDTENYPTDRMLAYIGSPNLTVRSELPLLPVVSQSEAENSDLSVPFFKHDPRVVGIMTDHRHVTNVPGFWPGDSHQFGIISFNKRGYMLGRKFNDPKDDQEALHAQGILSSFGWLSAQANFLGFTTFNDITYPIVSQTIITNGKLWSFYVYQLNTTLLHSDHTTNNPKRNICWATPEMKLYEDIQGDKVIGLNEDVVKLLVKLYANVPEERLGISLRPYLSTEEKVVADYADQEKREWLEREYKFIVANRPRHKLPYEVYHWEKIYKIDNKTRPMEPRRRPFELFENPYARRLDDRQANYIPRALRPHLKRHQGRYAREFFDF